LSIEPPPMAASWLALPRNRTSDYCLKSTLVLNLITSEYKSLLFKGYLISFT
jgi:hypothetical protein